MSAAGWGWSLRPGLGAPRRPATGWADALVAAAPWLTLLVLLMMFHLMSGAFAAAQGVVFELPGAGFGEGDRTQLVALVLPMTHETFVFFDDARYVLDDGSSLDAFCEQLTERAEKLKERSLLILADRRVASGDLMTLAACAKRAGISRILFAEKKAGGSEE